MKKKDKQVKGEAKGLITDLITWLQDRLAEGADAYQVISNKDGIGFQTFVELTEDEVIQQQIDALQAQIDELQDLLKNK